MRPKLCCATGTLRDLRGEALQLWTSLFPKSDPVTPAEDRVSVAEQLATLRREAMDRGERVPLVRRVGCPPGLRDGFARRALGNPQVHRSNSRMQGSGWSATYIESCAETLRESLDDLGIGWGPSTEAALEAGEGALDVDAAGAAIREAAVELGTAVRALTGSDATYNLKIDNVNEDAYWAYWLDGTGSDVRMQD